MTTTGLPIFVCAPCVDESRRDAESPDAYLDRIVRDKLEAVREALLRASPEGINPGGILVADTIVVAPDANVLGKPGDASRARAMLAELAGRTHEVRTRFALADRAPAGDKELFETVTTRVTFRTMSSGEIDAYAATGEGLDKAGAYAAQGRAAAFVERIEGSYTNVVGLPLCEVVVGLRALGWIGDG
jgi:septum formation protein